MVNGWLEADVEPPHRGDAPEARFRETCEACPHRIGTVEIEPLTGVTFIKCARCTCPLKIVVHRYGLCPAGFVPPPEVP